MAKKGKTALKKWDFRGKKGVIGSKKIWAGNQTRQAKWSKMHPLFVKMDIKGGMKG